MHYGITNLKYPLIQESTDGVMNVGAEADCATFTVDHAELVNRGKNNETNKMVIVR
jgi:hypothetical protein